jgi:nucleoside-diphosphate-sugar epimerase
MIKNHKILFTGITGAVGSWIAGEALSRGHGILAIMRDDEIEDAGVRVHDALDIAGSRKHLGNIEIVKGDVSEDMSPIAETPKSADVSMIFHCAASTEFSDNNTEQSLQVNVEGTKNILELAAKLNVPLCYVSTAYIAGVREGIAKENETDIAQTFNNVYERTKCKAEGLVHEWSKKTGLPAFVFRPSIVVGDSIKGRIATFNGMYNMLRFFDTVGPIIGDEEIRAVAKADATKNFIPVDYLAKAVWHIVDHGVAGTYHITNPNPMKLGQLRDIYENLFDIKAKLVTEEEYKGKKPTRAERLYRKASSLYSPYLAAEPVFDRTNADAILKHSGLELPAIDNAYFARLLKYAKSVQWGQSQPKEHRLSSRSISSIERYFTDFMVRKMHKQLLPDLRIHKATIRNIKKNMPDNYC